MASSVAAPDRLIGERKSDIGQLRRDTFAAFERFLSFAWKQVWVAAFAILCVVIALVILISTWHWIRKALPGWHGIGDIVASFIALCFCALAYLRFYGFRLSMFGEIALAHAVHMLTVMYGSIAEQAAKIEQASVKVVYGSSDATLAEITDLSKEMLVSLEEYENVKSELRSKGARFVETTGSLVRGTAISTMATIFVTIFVAFQVFDLLLNLLQYSRSPIAYTSSQTFMAIDHAVLNSLSTITILVLGIALFVLLAFAFVYFVARLSFGRAAKIINRVHKAIAETAPPNEEIVRTVSRLIERLVENNIRLARRMDSYS